MNPLPSRDREGAVFATGSQAHSAPLRVCSYEDRPAAMDSLILMGESLCRADQGISLHLTVPDAPEPVRAWAKTRPEVVLTTTRPAGVAGWDVKAWLLLQELDAGNREALWLDDDMIVTRPVSPLLKEFPPDILIVAEEWDRVGAEGVAHLWDAAPVRPVAPVNSCFVRVTEAQRPLLERWLQATQDPLYRKAQSLPFEQRPWRLSSDQVLLTALLGGAEFSRTPFERILMGRHIAQCAGSSGYALGDRLRDLVRGLPPMIHCIGRKPWTSTADLHGAQRYMLDLATDVSPYVMAAERVAKDLNMAPPWIATRTAAGGLLRALTFRHPALAGLPLATLHSVHTRIFGLRPHGTAEIQA
jgi:hypothetical protein